MAAPGGVNIDGSTRTSRRPVAVSKLTSAEDLSVVSTTTYEDPSSSQTAGPNDCPAKSRVSKIRRSSPSSRPDCALAGTLSTPAAPVARTPAPAKTGRSKRTLRTLIGPA
ncbi:MAG TPA: hypothetical protein VF219_13115 [Vicinamibacterales bacterium]